MNQEQRTAIIQHISDANLQQKAMEHIEYLHPCVWLVQDANGPLEAGGNPRLPVGQDWPREDGKPLAYLMTIDASLLPEWSLLPRDCGKLLFFVGHTICHIIIADPAEEMREVKPPLEEYLSEYPIAGDVLEPIRFRLQEGLHAGVPVTWSPADDERAMPDYRLTEALRDLNGALQPNGSFGRLFGHHEWWVSADAPSITRYSYMERRGYPGGWYEDLGDSVDKLQRKLEEARRQGRPPHEPMPAIADSVLQACEKWVVTAEKEVADMLQHAGSDARSAIEANKQTLERRRNYWQKVKVADPETSNRALTQLMSIVAEIYRQFGIDLREKDKHVPQALNAALEQIENAKAVANPLYGDLLEALTPMQYARQQNNVDAIRGTWLAHELKLIQHSPDLLPHQICTGLEWRLLGFESLNGWLQRDYEDPEKIAKKIAAIQWWQNDVQHHEAQLAFYRPLLVMDSDGGPYFWGDAGWAIVLADYREVAQTKLGRLAIALDVS